MISLLMCVVGLRQADVLLVEVNGRTTNSSAEQPMYGSPLTTIFSFSVTQNWLSSSRVLITAVLCRNTRSSNQRQYVLILSNGCPSSNRPSLALEFPTEIQRHSHFGSNKQRFLSSYLQSKQDSLQLLDTPATTRLYCAPP